jgi:hypothetical protein
MMLAAAACAAHDRSTISAGSSVCGHLVTVEQDGSASAGSKAALRRAFAAGTPLRVGWELDWNSDGVIDIRHWANAAFSSEFEDQIFTQVEEIHRQVPRVSEHRIEFSEQHQTWRGLLSTDGRLIGRFEGDAAQEWRVRSHWCADVRTPQPPRDLRPAGMPIPAPVADPTSGGTNILCALPRWRFLYRHDEHGKAMAGSKDALLAAARRGLPIRVAWGMRVAATSPPRSVEHAADPLFLTIMNGQEIFIQLPEHIAQESYSQPEKARFDEPAVMWRGMMGTNGSFDAVWVNRATGAVVRRVPQRAAIAWFALGASPECESQSPLDLALPNGVMLDQSEP